MTIGGSIFLIAVGAVLRYAVATQQWHGIRVHTVGLIVIVVGVVCLALALIRAVVLAVRGGLARRELSRRRTTRRGSRASRA
jgi:hypothetical protein